ncbi:hypothetical protein SAMN05421743_11498 [Thalassobacillus cyri]|uniref:WYL domain-containing protein n=1 Tax=Thalassobacillus cyri TaxID=571932 RepID=A0A1H4G8J1_9BACI|nr:hypothetical protein [Thalassobacillus cyri]SEB05909.1 hypothetical protein SAMN05421743_11498 [Thalassobacillus cyri]
MNGVLHRAQDSGKKLEMIYVSCDNQITHRIVKVLQVNEEEILAFCYKRRQVRRFKKNNILSVGSIRKQIGA